MVYDKDSVRDLAKYQAQLKESMRLLLLSISESKVKDTRNIEIDLYYKALNALDKKDSFAAKLYIQTIEKISRQSYYARLSRTNFILAFGDNSQKNSKDITNSVKKALFINPNGIEALNFMGVFYSKNGNPEEAEKYLKKALELEPESAITNSNIGMLYFHRNGGVRYGMEHLEKGEKILKDWLKELSYQSKADLSHIRLDARAVFSNLGNAYYQIWQHFPDVLTLIDAKRCYLRALYYGGRDKDVYNALGAIYTKLYRYDMAIKCYIRSCDLNPVNFEAYIGVAQLCITAKYYDLAKKAVDLALIAANDKEQINLANKIYSRAEEGEKIINLVDKDKE